MCNRRHMKHASAFIGAGVLCACLIAAPAGVRVSAGQPPAGDAFQDVAFLVGRWEGQSDGQPGAGTVRRDYERV